MTFIIAEELWIAQCFITCHPAPSLALRTPFLSLPPSLRQPLLHSGNFISRVTDIGAWPLLSMFPRLPTVLSILSQTLFHGMDTHMFSICSLADGHQLCFSLGLSWRILWTSYMTFAWFWIPCMWNLLASTLFRFTSSIWMPCLLFSCMWLWCVVWWGWSLCSSMLVMPPPLSAIPSPWCGFLNAVWCYIMCVTQMTCTLNLWTFRWFCFCFLGVKSLLFLTAICWSLHIPLLWNSPLQVSCGINIANLAGSRIA